MELAQYIVDESVLVLMLPRFVTANNTVDMVNNYLEGKGRIVRIVNSNALHEKQKPSDAHVLLFTSLNTAVLQNFNFKGVMILMLEWGFNEDMFNRFMSRYRNKIKVLRLSFLRDPRVIDINRFQVPMSTDYAAWYKAMTQHINASVEVRSMVGNHYYRDAPPQEIRRAIKDPKSYNYPEHEEFREPNHEEVKANARSVRNSDTITHPVELEGGQHYKSKDVDLRGDSPKIYSIAQTYLKAPGKYLILTSFRFGFGVSIISRMLNEIMGYYPQVVTPDMNDIDGRFDEFSEASQGILITSMIPKAGLKGIDRIIVVDNYNVDFIVHTIKAVCHYGCGSMTSPLVVTLLAVKYPEFFKETTREEDESERALNTIIRMEEVYKKLLSNSILVNLKDDVWEVDDPKLSYF